MKSPESRALSLAFTIAFLAGCSGGDNSPVMMSGPATAATDDTRVTQSDNLTAGEMALVNQANAEPAPPPKPDL